MKKAILLPLLLLMLPCIGISQSHPAPTTAAERLEGYQQRLELERQSLFRHVPFTNIGPTICSGRVVDIDVNPSRPSEMYVAYASGGLWYTNNNGTSFTPVFDKEASMTIGDVAVHWPTRTLWVGTGENNSSRSSYSGVGIYKSTDQGKTWKNMGLEESHHIGRILVHPYNPNILHVAVLGALYSDNPFKGVYSTSDGGVTWRQALYIDAQTGVIDLVMDPQNPNTLYAAGWQRERKAWNFSEAGPGSGIYVSNDSGRNWSFLTPASSGFPNGPGTGRIGLDIVRVKNQTILYAIVDNQNERPEKEPEKDKLTKAMLMEMHPDTFLSLSDKKIKTFLAENDFPSKYTPDTIRQLVKSGTIKPSTLAEYTMNANSKLFETEVVGTEVYRSTDHGKTWTRTHTDFLDNVFFTYGYYFGQIRASRLNPEKLYIMGVPLLKSADAGKTWKSIGAPNVHVDHHALWVNPVLEGHLVNGNDGGLNISYDDGATWIKCNSPAVGQLYSVAVDNSKPFNVYGGLQDNGVWAGPSDYRAGTGWHAYGQYPYREIMGGDGMQIAIDERDNNTIYTGFQFGNYYRTSRDGTVPEERITPTHDLGQRPYRWNWETPIHLSVHNQDILYMGAERVFRSMDKGKTWKTISGDLTNGEKEGDVAYGTLVSLHESPRIFGLIYAGSDDGLIHVTRDGGLLWKNITGSLPANMWISGLQASRHADGRVYATLNGYRWDHFNSYLYRSEDYGDTWERIGTNLPPEPINVIREDPHQPDILYAGTDHGLYISLDSGKTFAVFGDMPFVSVHDIAIQSRDKVLVAATHGRSLYKTSLQHVEQIDASSQDTLTCFNETLSLRYSDRWGTRSASWMEYFQPKISFPVYSLSEGESTLSVMADSLTVFTKTITLKKGLAYYEFTPECDETSFPFVTDRANRDKKEDEINTYKKADNGKYYLPPGKYNLRLTQNNHNAGMSLEIKTSGS